MNSRVGNVFRATEADLYGYMLHLESTCAAPTVAKVFVQSYSFAHALLGITVAPLTVQVSPRVKGAADKMAQAKRPLTQAMPLTTDAVCGLEIMCFEAPSDHLKLIACHLCFCIFSCCRFADSQHLTDIELSSSGELHLVETSTARYKSSTTQEKKALMLPLYAVGQGLYHRPWAVQWITLRDKFSLHLKSYALPAWGETTGAFIDRPMMTAEAHCVLLELLDLAGVDMDPRPSCHSLKSTLLTWCSKSNQVSFTDRPPLGSWARERFDLFS